MTLLNIQIHKRNNRFKVGACIVNEDKKIVGIGYNGFPKNCSDDHLPWSRVSTNGSILETKYPFGKKNSCLISQKQVIKFFLNFSLPRRNECNIEQKRGQLEKLHHVRVHVSVQRMRQANNSIRHKESRLPVWQVFRHGASQSSQDPIQNGRRQNWADNTEKTKNRNRFWIIFLNWISILDLLFIVGFFWLFFSFIKLIKFFLWVMLYEITSLLHFFLVQI